MSIDVASDVIVSDNINICNNITTNISDNINISEITAKEKQEQDEVEQRNASAIYYENGNVYHNSMYRYVQVPCKGTIEDMLNRELQKFNRINQIPNALIRYPFEKNEKIPNECKLNLRNTRLFVDVIESHLISVLNDYRATIRNELNQIDIVVQNKKKRKLRIKTTHENDIIREPIGLALIARLPDDVIRYVAEYVFNPTIRLKCVKSICPNIPQQLSAFKIDNLKKIYNNSLQLVIYEFYRKLIKNKDITRLSENCKIFNAQVHSLYYYSVMKSATNKPQKIAFICERFNACELIVARISDMLEMNIYKIPKNFELYNDLQEYLRRMYHVIIYTSRPVFHKRKVNRIST